MGLKIEYYGEPSKRTPSNIRFEIDTTDKELADKLVDFLRENGFVDNTEFGPGLLEHPNGSNTLIYVSHRRGTD